MEREKQDGGAYEMLLPKCMAIRHGSCYLSSVHDESNGVVVVEVGDDGGGGANNPRCRFYLEASKEHDGGGGGLMHVRCCYNNKYWVPQQIEGQEDDGWIIGTADEPEEDLSKPSCTLFKLHIVRAATEQEEHSIRFLHYKLGKCVTVLPSSHTPTSCRSYLQLRVAHGEADVVDAFTFLDLSQQKQLPKYLAFKGDNGKYLCVQQITEGLFLDTLGTSAHTVEHEYLQFSSEDIHDPRVVHTSFTNDGGIVSIKSNHVDKFWSLVGNWIWPFTDCEMGSKSWFEVIAWDTDEAGDNFIVLRNQGNNKICSRLPTDGMLFFPRRDCLVASDDSITPSARLQLEEPVLSRLIYDINFHLGEARVYTKEVVNVDTRTVVNDSNTIDTTKLTFTVTDTVTTTWNFSVSVKGGVKTTFKTGIPRIVDGRIEVSSEITISYSRGETVTETKTRATEYTALVPAHTKVTVRAVASKGACNVPYSYKQKDVLYGGQEVIHEFHDGIFSGVSANDIKYEKTEEKLNAM